MCPNEPTISNETPIRMVAVHLGANNARSNEVHRGIAKSVCKTVMKEAKSKIGDNYVPRQQSKTGRDQVVNTAVDAVVRAIELMENEKTLNCGYGSNLNIDGKVECDASLMSSRNRVWAGIGSVSGCKSPIRLAESLYERYVKPRPMGLIQPNFLVASGARRWMRKHRPDLVVPESCLISSRALSRYQKVKSDYDLTFKNLKTSIMDSNEIDCDQTNTGQPIDTVGAVAVDCDNNFACAVSSGGIILKHQGRLGQAAVPGAGCWAQDSSAITTTGVGEYLTATLFARNFHEKLEILKMSHKFQHSPGKLNSLNGTKEIFPFLIEEATNQCFRDFVESPALGHVPTSERLAGMLVVSSFPSGLPTYGQCVVEDSDGSTDDNSTLYLSYGHNTRSLCVGYMDAIASEAESIVSQYENDDEAKRGRGGAPLQPVGIAYGTIKLDCRRMSLSI